MEFKKFTTYEFKVNYHHGDEAVLPKEVMYKINEGDDTLSVVSFEVDGQKIVIPATMLIEISKAMQEINPFDFALGE